MDDTSNVLSYFVCQINYDAARIVHSVAACWLRQCVEQAQPPPVNHRFTQPQCHLIALWHCADHTDRTDIKLAAVELGRTRYKTPQKK